MNMEIKYVCGHEGTIEVYGKDDKRNYVASMKERELCPECYKKEQQRLSNQETQKNGFQELTGSEKQINWANQIRLEIHKSFLDSEKNERGLKFLKALKRVSEDVCIEDVEKEIKNYIETTKEAKEYIDNRGQYNLEFFTKKITK